ncbi:MAG: c-type cytochrome domain-containing protein, partial [Planctomycetota bacterium]
TPPAVTPPSTVPAVAPAMPAAAMPMTLWADVAPILAERCTACHDPDSKKGGLDMTSFTAALQGGGSGKSIVPGQPDQSRLFRMITQQERPFMPRDGDPLEASAIVKIRQWIEQGAAEDTALALSFMSEKTAKQKALAEAVEASMSGTAPLPENLPTIAVRYPPRTMPVLALARSPRAPLLALPGLAQVLLLDGALQTRGVLPCELPRIGAIGFSSDGSLLAIAGGEAGRNGKALVYDVKSGAVTGTFGKERDVPLAVAIHRGRGLIALGGSSKRARVYALGDGSEVLDGKHDDFVLALEFSPDGSTLAAADRSGVILLWETDGGRIAQTLRLPKGAANAVAFHRQGRMLAVAAGDGTVRMFSVQDGKEQWQKNAHLGEALALAFGPNNRLATGGTDGRIAVFDLDGKAVARSEPGGDQVQAIAFGVDDNIVIGGDAQGRLQYFDTSTKTVTASQPLSPAQ